MRIIFFLMMILTLLGGRVSSASESAQVDTGKVLAQLVSTHYTAPAGETIYVSLRTVLDDKWHTYWRNPGDSGEPVQMTWSLPDGVSAGEIVWPLPTAIPTGPIVNYGFEGTPMFPVPITLPRDAAPGDVITIAANAYYLVCKDICIPEDADLSLSIEIGEAELNERWNNLTTLALSRAPKAGMITAGVTKTGDTVELLAKDLPDGDFSNAFFFPYDQGIVLPAAPQTLTMDDGILRLKTTADFAWDNDLRGPLKGVLRYTQNGKPKGEIISATIGERFGVAPLIVSESNANLAPNTMSLWGAIIGAFIGGLILNLMPCVFPVISMKALSLAKLAHGERAAIRREAWAYVAGVLATFLILVIILLGLKSVGADLGWGFQLQSPVVVGILALVLFTIGLNLLGVFEFGAGLQNTGSGLASQGGLSGAFFTGALAVIVATPCTAPFMAGAIGYAFAQTAVITIAVFAALAVGFAVPFLILGYAPGLLTKLPKPGPWMVRFKEVLAFPMLIAAVWLVWVLSLQAGSDGVGRVGLAMVAIGFALWCFKRGHMWVKIVGGAAILVALALPFTINALPQTGAISTKANAQSWDPSAIPTLTASGQNVFVDFTAAWCVTCKVNERLVLETEAGRALLRDTNTVMMIADWTNKDDRIAGELARHGRSGVPLYLVYRAGETAVDADNNPVNPVILPQVLSLSVLRDALQGE